MKSLPTELNNELLKDAFLYGFLVAIEFSSSYLYYTTLDVDIVYQGNTYISRGIQIGAAEYSLTTQIDQISLEIDNVKQEYSSILLNNEMRGKKVTISLIALDKNLNIIGVTDTFIGIIDTAELDEQRVRFEVSSPLIRWKKRVPRREHGANCYKIFKSTDCGYTGVQTWCNQAYDRCLALSNTANFGGFRWLPELMTKAIWWGRERAL